MRFRILVLGVVASTAPAHAEFVLLSAPPIEAGASVTPSSIASTRLKPPVLRKRPAPEPAVVGFGDQIPLSFAVRQIVPARFQVAFGQKVDQERRVDWRGGKPWQSALSEALKPVGLTIDVHGLTVTIVGADANR